MDMGGAGRIDGAGGDGPARPRRPRDAAARFVASLVAAALEVTADRLWARTRDEAPVAFARQVAIYLMHTRLRLTLRESGGAFGRDRTTAAHACRTVEERRDDPRVDAMVELLERAVDSWQRAGGFRR